MRSVEVAAPLVVTHPNPTLRTRPRMPGSPGTPALNALDSDYRPRLYASPSLEDRAVRASPSGDGTTTSAAMRCRNPIRLRMGLRRRRNNEIGTPHRAGNADGTAVRLHFASARAVATVRSSRMPRAPASHPAMTGRACTADRLPAARAPAQYRSRGLHTPLLSSPRGSAPQHAGTAADTGPHTVLAHDRHAVRSAAAASLSHPECSICRIPCKHQTSGLTTREGTDRWLRITTKSGCLRRILTMRRKRPCLMSTGP